MYSFKTGAGKRRQKQLLRLMGVVIFILVIALAGVTYSYLRSRSSGDATSSAILSRAVSEASSAQSTVYRLTQSSGTNTNTLLSTLRAHIYALESLNMLASNIYGPGTSLADGKLLTECQNAITECETRLQAGSVITTQITALKDNVDLIVAGFGEHL
ncbi:MAG: hypothetical protein J6K32_11800 [Clostridia bacterium]|nr:hypothetical protein [Clostridia bacterium]